MTNSDQCEHRTNRASCHKCNPHLAVSPDASRRARVQAEIRQEDRRAAGELAHAWEAGMRGQRHYNPNTGEVEPGAESQSLAEASWRKTKHKFEAHPVHGQCMRCGMGLWGSIHY
jgi:hypothetical protein